MVILGSTFQSNHLYVVISDPAKHAGKCGLVNLTTQRAASETTCVLAPEDFPSFIHHATVVNYSDALLAEQVSIEKIIKNGEVRSHPDMAADVLKRIGSAEFRSTPFSYRINEDGLKKFVSTPELQSEDSIGGDPLPPGQLWVISPGGQDEHAGLSRLDTTVGPGAGVRILNQPPPPPFKESVKCAEQNLYTRAKQLVGDRDTREHEFSVQLRAFDAAKSGTAVGVGVMIALCSALLQKGIQGGHVVVGGLNLGGSIDPVYSAVNVVELAVEKGATKIVISISARRLMNNLPDELALKINIQYYTDVREVLLKVLET